MDAARFGTTASRWIARYVVIPLILAAALLSLVPFIETDIWWIRFLDFARVQFLVALAVLLVLYVLLRREIRAGGWAVIGLAVVAMGYNLYRIAPYVPIVPAAAIEVAECPAGSRVRVLVANVQESNETARELFAIVAQNDPDLLLLLETDSWWDARLDQLRDRFSHRIQHIPEDDAHFGMHLLSKYPLVDPNIRFLFDALTPTIFSGVRLPDGSTVSFVGVHPQPPLYWSQPTTMRDGHLLAIALEARDRELPTIIAGDFNAVPWERVTRRMMRIGGLLDPRAGRGLYPTYDAQSLLMSWPLDQVLYQDRFALLAFERLPSFGSDHYPVLADLCLLPSAASRQAAPALERGDLEEARSSIEAARELDADGGS